MLILGYGFISKLSVPSQMSKSYLVSALSDIAVSTGSAILLPHNSLMAPHSSVKGHCAQSARATRNPAFSTCLVKKVNPKHAVVTQRVSAALPHLSAHRVEVLDPNLVVLLKTSFDGLA